METIRTYIDNMFMTLPQNKEVLHAKEELLSMMEDKYNELKNEGRSENEVVGIVISEFGNLDEVAEELGLSDTMRTATKEPSKNIVTLDMAKDFIENRIKASYKVGIGVFLIIWSPVLLIFLTATDSEEFLGVYNGGAAIGIISLLSLVAIGVGLLIISGVQLSRFDLDKNVDFLLDSSAQSYVKIEEDQNRMVKTTKIAIGVMLCILSAIPLLVFSLLEIGDDFSSIGIAIILLLVSIAVFLFITAGMKQAAYDILLKKGEYSDEARNFNKKTEVIGSIYWPFIVIIYLYWSFTSGNWGFTWIIWPLSGLLFAVVLGLIRLFQKTK